MKRPSFQFYPGDWTGNSNLRRCSHSEKGVWLDVICLMHDQTEYGVLRWPLKEIAQAVGCSLSMLRSLVTKGVLKGDDKRMEEPYVYIPRSGRRDGEPVTLLGTQDGPLWYSSRMVKDEYVRTIRGESTRFSDEFGAAPKLSPKPPFGDGSSSSSSSSSSTSVNTEAKASRPAVTESEIWKAGADLLLQAGMKTSRPFIGKLVKDHGSPAVMNAIQAAIVAQPADPAAYIRAASAKVRRSSAATQIKNNWKEVSHDGKVTL